MVFVNPYTFISFPTKVERRAPLFHTPTREQAKERYTGTLSVTWTLNSPLAIPVDGSWGCGAEGDPDTALSGELRIPGASVKGAVRSLHEALFAGCARVIDSEFTPVYRELMSPNLQNGWTLAVVTNAGGNLLEGPDPEVRVMLCYAPVWTRGAAIRTKALKGEKRLPRTGDFIVPGAPLNSSGRPNVRGSVNEYLPVERGDDWPGTFASAVKKGMSVILVTDTSARDSENPYYWATAQPKTTPGSVRVLPSEALQRFRLRLRGADMADEGADDFVDVSWPPKDGAPVAQRRGVDGHFRQGDVIWVRVADGGEVSDIKLSLGWRAPAGGRRATLADRIPQAAHPCGHIAAGLCLSCVIFGSVDATAAKTEMGQQDSYGGHVRFGDITGECLSGRRNIRLMPLGTPNAGAGMFYLKPVTEQQMAGTMIRPDHPSRWDSAAGESAGSRDLRGRKFYWHSNPESQRVAKGLDKPRYERRPEIHKEKHCSQIHLVEQATLHQTITFDGLDATALASLLATFNPAHILGEGPDGGYALHLGRGKPLGLGSVQAEVAISMTTTADRYSDTPTVLDALPDMAEALASGIPARCGDLSVVKKEAARVLALHGLGEREADVTYPTTEPWSRYEEKAFHESFAFFQRNSGQVRKVGGKLARGSWSPLPLVLDPQGQE